MLKAGIRGLEASPLYMAEAVKMSAVANQNENRKEGKESDKEKTTKDDK